jgi:putative membrane protein
MCRIGESRSTRRSGLKEVAVVWTIAAEAAGFGGWGPGSWWPIFPLFWVLVWGAVIFAVFRFRGGDRWRRGRSAEDVLAEEYARGAITVEEYRERLRVLKEHAS